MSGPGLDDETVARSKDDAMERLNHSRFLTLVILVGAFGRGGSGRRSIAAVRRAAVRCTAVRCAAA